MRRFTLPQVLRFAPDDELSLRLESCAMNLGECLRLFASQPGAHFIEDDSGVRFFNHQAPPESIVLRTRSTARADDDDIDAELRRFETYGVALDWTIFPSSSPDDLPLRLRQRGLVQGRCLWMLADLAVLPSPPSMPRNLRIEVAVSPIEMDGWRRAAAAGFELSEASATRYHDAYASNPRSSEHVALRVHYVGYMNDVPVSSSTLLLARGIACIYDVSTPPEHRQKGYGRCLTRVGLDEARRSGYRYAGLMASPLGYSVYRSLGFDLEFEIPEYRWTPRPALVP